MSEESPLFLKTRTFAFSCVNLVSFVWILLYSVVIFLQWDYMGGSERSLIAVMLITNVITLVTLLILLLLEFRVWLDAARVGFLLVLQAGTSGAFVYWKPRFKCGEQVGDQEGICHMVSTYVLLVSWVIPALLIIYLCGLVYRVYRYRSLQPEHVDLEKGPSTEKGYRRRMYGSLLPIMTGTPISLAFPSEVYHNRHHSVAHTRKSTVSAVSRYSTPPPTPHTARMSTGRLAKRSPTVDLL